MNDDVISTQGAKRRSRLSRTRFVALTLVGIVLLAAACGGSAPSGVASVGSTTSSTLSSPADNSGPPISAATAKAQLAYSECIRSHGVANFPDPQPGGGYARVSGLDQNSAQFLSAQKACASLEEAAGMAPPTKAEQEAHEAMMLKISACMRAHGVTNFPDPNPQGGFAVSPSSLDMTSPHTPQRQRGVTDRLEPHGVSPPADEDRGVPRGKWPIGGSFSSVGGQRRRRRSRQPLIAECRRHSRAFAVVRVRHADRRSEGPLSTFRIVIRN